MEAACVRTAALLLCVYAAHCEARVSSSSLRISRSPASRGGAKSYFEAETAPPSPAPSGFVWPTEAPSTFSSAYTTSGEDDGISIETAGSKAKVKPYKSHFNIKLKQQKYFDIDDDDSDSDSVDDWFMGWQPPTSVALSVDAGVRAFVRAMSADDMDGERHLVAKVVVLGDSRELVDAAVDVVAVELPMNASDAAAFRLQTRAQSPRLLSGRVLVQVLWNTQAFQLQTVNASGDSVVIVEQSAFKSSESWLGGSQALALVASNSSRLFVNVAGVRATSLALTAQDDAALVVQSSSGVLVSGLELRQRNHASLALVAQWISSSVVGVSMESAVPDSGVLCVHSVSLSTVSLVNANVSASGGLLQWATSSSSHSSCSALTINATGDSTCVDMGSMQSDFVSVELQGDGSTAVVNSRNNVVASSVGATAHVTNVAHMPSRDKAGVADTRCSLQSLAAKFPLPRERAASIALASGQSWQVVSASPVQSTSHTDAPKPEPSKSNTQQPTTQQAANIVDDEAEQREKERQEEAGIEAEEDAERETERQEQYSTPPPYDSHPVPQPSPEHESPQLEPTVPIKTEAPVAVVSQAEGFVNGSLHMLGSIPYVDAIVVFLVSAWILHHLLQCYDRRQRRRRYTPVDDATADRVWI